MSSFATGLPPNVPSRRTGANAQYALGARCAPSVFLTQCNQMDNAYTQCIKAEIALRQRIVTSPMFQLSKFPARYWKLRSLPFDEMPADALRLHAAGALPVGSIVTNGAYYNVPFRGGTPTGGYQVPAGYDGVINVTVCKFVPQTGPDFQDGSGTLIWTLGINNALEVNYTSINVTLGASSVLGPVTKGGGIRVKANDLIQWLVSAPGGVAALDPAGIVVCAIQGWLYPNR